MDAKWSTSHPGRPTPGKRTSERNTQEAAHVPQPVWTVLEKGKSLAPAGNRIPDCPDRSKELNRVHSLGSP